MMTGVVFSLKKRRIKEKKEENGKGNNFFLDNFSKNRCRNSKKAKGRYERKKRNLSLNNYYTCYAINKFILLRLL